MHEILMMLETKGLKPISTVIENLGQSESGFQHNNYMNHYQHKMFNQLTKLTVESLYSTSVADAA